MRIHQPHSCHMKAVGEGGGSGTRGRALDAAHRKTKVRDVRPAGKIQRYSSSNPSCIHKLGGIVAKCLRISWKMKCREPVDRSDVVLASERIGIPCVKYIHVVVSVSRVGESQKAVNCCDGKGPPAAYRVRQLHGVIVAITGTRGRIDRLSWCKYLLKPRQSHGQSTRDSWHR